LEFYSDNFEVKYKLKNREFATKYYLGELVAGNFFQTEWDKYVEAAKRLLSAEPMKQANYPVANKEAQY
jgi:hypothetical protein